MLDALEIRKEIARLEYEESSYPNYAKLATLYTIRAEMNKENEPQSAAPRAVVQSIPAYGNSEFLRTVSDKEPRDAWRVMDELMESLSVMQPKTYAAVMNKLNNL